MNLWNNLHSLTEYEICDSTIIQIRPSRERSNVYVFSEDGYVHHVDGYNFKIISSTKLSEKKLSCVEEVKVRSARGFIVADVEGNLTLFNSSFDNPTSLGKKISTVTAIQCIGRGRTLIAYSLKEGTVRVEMIRTLDGDHITAHPGKS